MDIFKNISAAGSSAVITVTGIHPIDVVKTRLQVSSKETRNYSSLGVSGTIKNNKSVQRIVLCFEIQKTIPGLVMGACPRT